MCDRAQRPAALRLLREVVTREDGNPTGANQHSKDDGGTDDNIIGSSEQGTSKDYTLDRLAREEAKANRPPFGFTPTLRRHLSSQEKAAQQVGTNRQYVSDAKRGASSAPHCMALFSSNGERVRARSAKMGT